MSFYQIGDQKPQLKGQGHFVAPSADVIGDVLMENNSSVWFQVVLRGDNERITIGENSNIQDGSVVHTDPGFAVTIGKNAVVGHKVMLHGCTIGDGALIGMNAVILNGAVIGKGCVVAANSLITEGMVVPDGAMVMGSPAKIKGEISEDLRRRMLQGSSAYVEKARFYQQDLERLSDQFYGE